jgi:hypothetical protein
VTLTPHHPHATEAHATALRTALRTIAAYWNEMVDPEATPRRPTAGRSSERVDPINAHALDVRRDTLATLNTWTEGVLTERGLPGTGLDRHDAPGLAHYLETHTPWIAEQPAAPTAVTQLAACARAVKAIARPTTPDDMRFLGPCPTCDTRLHATDHQNLITCPTCDTTTDRHIIRALAHHTAAQTHITATEAPHYARAFGLTLNASTIRSWARRGRITPTGTNPTGDPTYLWAAIHERATK